MNFNECLRKRLTTTGEAPPRPSSLRAFSEVALWSCGNAHARAHI
ncbi:MAG: hypothetical protein ABIG87_02300 [Patescibacteria group bacterium]